MSATAGTMSDSGSPMKQRIWPNPCVEGGSSGTTQNRAMPVCWMPSRKRTLMDPPGGSGAPGVTASTESVALKPPPFGCAGGVSRVVPFTNTLDVPEPHGGRSTRIEMFPDERARRSATPAIDGNVLMSTIRNRSRVKLRPVLFVHVRRMSYVPNVELLPGSDVTSRSLLGAASIGAHVSSRLHASPVAVFATGDDRFSGPGAPSRCPAAVKVPLVSTKMKSVALLLESARALDVVGGVVCMNRMLVQLPPPALPLPPSVVRRVKEWLALVAPSAG